ncbi:MAG: methionyl-tRNA formyltransferase [Akkermansiaceae bacterium]|nr:methionyl-tRNA formyltransferase [Akkermansiaceae bacterium]
MRVIFVATGDIALPSFRHLLAHGPKPLALVTQPDKPVGRHQALTPPRIKVEALEAGLPVLQPDNISSAVEEMRALDPEVIVVFAYGQILRKDVLKLPSKAIINLHGSLLPRHRGASCVQAAIDMGDEESGIAAIHVVKKLDAGDVIFDKAIPIQPDETGGTLHDKLADVAAEVLAETLKRIGEGTDTRTPQDDSLSNYAPKLERDDGRIDWSMNAEALERRIRAYDPWPGTFTTVQEDGKWKRLKVFPPVVPVPGGAELAEGFQVSGKKLFVACGGAGAVELLHVQPEGGKRMTVEQYLAGRKPQGFQ